MTIEKIKKILTCGWPLAQGEVDWLIAEVERLKPFEHEYICKRCGIRQNDNRPGKFPAF